MGWFGQPCVPNVDTLPWGWALCSHPKQPVSTVWHSPLSSLQSLPYVRTFKWRAFKDGICFPSTSGVSDITASLHLLLLMILQLYHLPPPLRPVVSNSSCLVTQHQSLHASCSTVLLYFSRCYKIKNAFFIFCVCFACIICVKSVINLLQCSTVQPIVLVGYLG